MLFRKQSLGGSHNDVGWGSIMYNELHRLSVYSMLKVRVLCKVLPCHVNYVMAAHCVISIQFTDNFICSSFKAALTKGWHLLKKLNCIFSLLIDLIGICECCNIKLYMCVNKTELKCSNFRCNKVYKIKTDKTSISLQIVVSSEYSRATQKVPKTNWP